MTEYEKAPGLIFYMGKKRACECGNSEFRTEIGPEPTRFWCTCNKMYTEDLAKTMVESAE